MLDATEKALGLPGVSKNKTAWKCLVGWEIRGTTRVVAMQVDTQTCQRVGTPSMGLDESRAHLSPREGLYALHDRLDRSRTLSDVKILVAGIYTA